jgi:hypothetical protein
MTKKKQVRLARWHVRWSKNNGRWEVLGPGRRLLSYCYGTKVQMVRSLRELWLGEAVGTEDPPPVRIDIHLKDGTVGDERTYPRAADPRRSRG